jgi:hypothetical protein
MRPPVQIFRVQSDGGLHWMEAAEELERAKARVKTLGASSPGEYVITNEQTGERLSIKTPRKRIVFQIGYEERALNARAELFRCFGHEVISVNDNEAAKRALATIREVDVFIVGNMAPEQTRKEMVDWLKVNFPEVEIVALIPSGAEQMPRADHNVVLNDWDEWLPLLPGTAG